MNQWITRLKAPVRLPVFGEPHWRGDSKRLFYFSTQQNSMMAVNVEEKGGEISLGAPRALFPLSSPYATLISFEVTPNGKRFLILTVNFPTASIPITLVTNWEAELKKKRAGPPFMPHEQEKHRREEVIANATGLCVLAAISPAVIAFLKTP